MNLSTPFAANIRSNICYLLLHLQNSELYPADNSSPITLTGFTNGVAASVRLKAVNANGSSTDSAAVGFTPEAAAVPAQPVPAIPGFLTWMLLGLTGWVGLLTLSRRRRT